MNTQPEEEFEEDEIDLYEHYKLIIDKGQAQIRIDWYLTEKIANATRNKIQHA